MKIKILDQYTDTLQQSMFNGEEATVYVVKRDYKINGPILLPKGSELRVEGGSISIGKSVNNNIPSGIYLLTSDQEKIRLKSAEDIKNEQLGEVYWNLCVTSRSDFSEDENSLKYTPTLIKFLDSGCVISNRTVNHFEMTLNCECRIMLPKDTARATLKITSDKVNKIQIDGKCNFQIHAENCWLERIFACTEGMCMNNRLKNNIDYNRFYNCRITSGKVPEVVAKDFKKFPSEVYGGNFISIGVGVALKKDDPDGTECSEALDWMILRDCEVDNIGLAGYVYATNCTFIYGDNVNNNYEMIHCTDHSRIINCVFDGYRSKEADHELKGDIVDTYNGHNIIISGCTFKDFKSPLKIEDDHVPGYHMITIKSHYNNDPELKGSDELSSNRGPQCGVVVRNCTFDLPEFTGNGIDMWNGPKDIPDENRGLNRQFTLIENNHINMPKSHAFIYCFGFVDYVRVLNNHGYVYDDFIYVPSLCPEVGGERVDSIVHNMVVKGNVLQFSPYHKNEPTRSKSVITGVNVENLTLDNNISSDYLWNFAGEQNFLYPLGTVRINNNTAINGTVFRGRQKVFTQNEFLQARSFFKGNVSNGKSTDFGNQTTADSLADSLNYSGRKFINTNTHEFMVYYSGDWIKRKLSGV